MAALAKYADLVARLGRQLTDDENTRYAGALSDASAAVAAYTRQSFQVVTEEINRRLTDSYIQLQRPVVSITSVRIPSDLQALTYISVPYQFDGVDRVSAYTTGDVIFNFPVNVNIGRTVKILYSHGYATVPDDVVGVVCSAAIRQLQSPAIELGYGLTSEAAGPFTRGYSPAAMTGAVYLVPAEQAILDRYRIKSQSMPVSSW